MTGKSLWLLMTGKSLWLTDDCMKEPLGNDDCMIEPLASDDWKEPLVTDD